MLSDHFFHLCVRPSLREWYLNGNYLIMIVSACIILPLAVMKQLGMFFSFCCHIFVQISLFFSRVHHSSTTPLCCCFPVYWVVVVSVSHQENWNCHYFNLWIIFFILFLSFNATQVTWATQAVSPSAAWCFSSFRWAATAMPEKMQTMSPVVKVWLTTILYVLR